MIVRFIPSVYQVNSLFRVNQVRGLFFSVLNSLLEYSAYVPFQSGCNKPLVCYPAL